MRLIPARPRTAKLPTRSHEGNTRTIVKRRVAGRESLKTSVVPPFLRPGRTIAREARTAFPPAACERPAWPGAVTNGLGEELPALELPGPLVPDPPEAGADAPVPPLVVGDDPPAGEEVDPTVTPGSGGV